MKNEIELEYGYAKIKIISPKYGIKYTHIDYDFLNKTDDIKSIYLKYDKKLNNFYAVAYLGVNNKSILLHRLIFNKINNKIQVDHINHDTLDNRKSNLRTCIHCQNSQNKQKYKNNTSGFKNIRIDKKSKKFIVELTINYKNKYIGRYKTIEEAKKAAIKARKKYYPFSSDNI